jgi:hypothetical protein
MGQELIFIDFSVMLECRIKKISPGGGRVGVYFDLTRPKVRGVWLLEGGYSDSTRTKVGVVELIIGGRGAYVRDSTAILL